MKRIFQILTILMLIAMLSACGGAKDSVDGSTTTTSADTSTSETVPVTEKITMEDLKKYVLVRPDEANQEIVDAAIDLRKQMVSELDVTVELKSDLHSDRSEALKIKEFEILVGACDRDETRAFMEDLRHDDYGYAMIGKKIVICGGSDEATLKALSLFTQNIVSKQEGEIFYDGSVKLLERGTYAVGTLKVQGIDIQKYEIVYPNRNETALSLAEVLRDSVCEKTGFVLLIKNDKEPVSENEILIGNTNRTCAIATQALKEGTYLIGADGANICARGLDGIGDYYAAYALIEALLDGAAVAHTVTLEAQRVEEVPVDEALTSMSFNLWVSSMTPDRMESVKQTILAYMPDTIGVQEASPSWIAYLNVQLKEIYSYVGLGRDGGSDGEHSAIFYRRDRFELIETGTKWMSDTPDRVSKFSESSLNRIFTYAILNEKKTGEDIMIVNTHLDHKSGTARDKQATVLMDFLKEYIDKYPIVLSGDFNANPSSEVYRIVTDQLADSAKIAQTAKEHYTYHGNGSASTYIDYLFVSRQYIAVSDYRVITEKYNDTLPSDHYPLVIEYNMIK